jgi:glycosyltransferase involved in cell wall biosynthesis
LSQAGKHGNAPREVKENYPVMIEVVIPAYNAGRFLRETLMSIAAQTVRPELVTVVDDASTDDTVAVARACAVSLADSITIQVLPNAGPRGPSSGRNTAIRRSSADWIALCDSDDLLAPTHHESLLRVTAAADAVLGFGDSDWFRDDGAGIRHTEVQSFFQMSSVAGLPATELAPDCFTLGDATFPAMLNHGLFGTSACLFRREAALRAGLFDESMMFVEDTDFFLRLSLQGRFAFTRTLTTHKRLHDGNLSQASNDLAFCRGMASSYLNLARRTEPPPLTPAQQVAVERALTRVVGANLFMASLQGAAAYWRAVRLAWRSGRWLMPAHPRHLVRLARRGFATDKPARAA